MPYIKVKAYPKDKAIKEKVADEIQVIFEKYWGCASEAISVSFEEVSPSDWQSEVVEKEIQQNVAEMLVLNGEKVNRND